MPLPSTAPVVNAAPSTESGNPARVVAPSARRAALLIGVHLVAALLVFLTGGPFSPLYSLMFLCLFLATLYFGAWGAAVSAGLHMLLVVTITLRLLNTQIDETSGTLYAALPPFLAFLEKMPLLGPLAFVGCQFTVALTTGFIARRFAHKANRALRQAERERAQAEQVQWLTDSVIMMQSLLDLDDVLSIALLRLSERLPTDSIAIYLCDPEDTVLRLAQTMGLPQNQVGRHRLPLAELPSLVRGRAALLMDGDEAKLWNNPEEIRLEAGVWAEVDARACAILTASLQTLEEAFGAIYVSAHHANAFTEEHRRLLTDFSRQVLYPIQRVRLEALATTDALTGLFNRRVFWRHINEEVRRSLRYGPPLSLLLLDIDHFKQVNDTLGHQAGDAILSQLAALLQRSIRATDTPVRYGGEELILLCPETRLAEAGGLAERIRQDIAKFAFMLPNGSATRITVSIGVAMLSEVTRDAGALVEAADAALYAAKAGGRNQVSLAATHNQPELGASPAERLPVP